MRKYCLFIIFSCSAFYPASLAIAHPVAFKNSFMLMPSFEKGRYDMQGNYAFARQCAIGLTYTRIDQAANAATFAFPQLNFLIKRWNEKNFQANIYAYAGLGVRDYL